MTKPDFEQTICNIKYQIHKTRKNGLEPCRVYMNYRTYLGLIGGVFHSAAITIIPDGKRRKETIYGVEIATSENLEDMEIDISVKQIY